MREDLRKQFSADDENNPLADVPAAQPSAAMRQAAEHQDDAAAGDERARWPRCRRSSRALQAEKERLEEVAAEADRGTAKGRTYEEEVAEALDELALAQGDVAEAVGDLRGGAPARRATSSSRSAPATGPPRGRIVFEAKNARLTRPEALAELDRRWPSAAPTTPCSSSPPTRRCRRRCRPLREYNGDKLIVAYDPDEGPLALQVAYMLARARVLMARGDGEGDRRAPR